jgi:TonB family protein
VGLFVAALLSWLLQAPVPSSQDAVRSLYAAADYEAAIALVATMDRQAVTADHELYRALCFLALGRTEEAESALQALVRLSPTYTLPEAEVSPRVLTMFRDVRRRVLPVIVREQYAAAKVQYDDRSYVEAAAALRKVLTLLADPDLAYPADAFADLRQLAEGFLRLSEMEVQLAAKAEAAKAQAAAEPAPPPPAPAASASSDLVVTKIRVYSAEDQDVRPPVERERFMPPWVPPAAMARSGREYRGEIEVVIDETGRVEQARVTRPTIEAYDVMLIGATRRWRFEPARRGAETVKYVRTFEFVLAPPVQRR